MRTITLDGLKTAFAGRGRERDPWRFVLRMTNAGGLAAVEGHDGAVTLTPGEVADLVAAVPALCMDPDTINAVMTTIRVLRAMNDQPAADTVADDVWLYEVQVGRHPVGRRYTATLSARSPLDAIARAAGPLLRYHELTEPGA